MEEALGQSIPLYAANNGEQFWGFADMMPHAIYIFSNRKCIYCNKSGAVLLGFNGPVDLQGRHIREFIPSVLLEGLESMEITPGDKGMAFPIFETKLVKTDGTVIDVEIAPSPFVYKDHNALYLIVRDITGSNKIKRSLTESEGKYKTLIEMLPDAICLRCGDRIIYANMAAVKILGCGKAEEIVGKDITDFIMAYPDSESVLIEYDRELKKNGYIPFREECYIRKSDGEILLTETAIRLISNGEEPVYLAIARDISERKSTEELRKNMEKKARELDAAVEYDKLRTEFFSNISHEFRTPLNVMLSALQLSGVVLNDSPASECKDKISKYMSLMKKNCYRLIKLVNNLIDITKIDTGYFKISPEECNIVDIIEDITLSVKNHVENKGISLTFDTDSEEIITACDPDKIERIMLNLLSNALKFTDSPGKIAVNVYDKSDKVIISVRDTGIGIPKDKETLIFDRFQQVDKSLSRNHEGSGIGLSLVKSLVEMHGGSIRLNNIYNQGSEFLVELPLNSYFDKGLFDKKRLVDQSKLERINIEFSDIYF